jgi:hypothetical protein
MVIDQKKLELLEKSLENPEKISIFKIFAKENSDMNVCFTEISFFQRLFHEIISHPTNETFELLVKLRKCAHMNHH